MAAPYNPPVSGEDFVTYVLMQDFNEPGRIKISPTIAAGDFKVSKDDGAEANLATLPSELPAGSGWVKITVSAAEMTAGNSKLKWKDQDNPPQWCDGGICIPTTAA